MSISTNKPETEDEKFADIVFTPEDASPRAAEEKPETPAEEKKVEEPKAEEKKKPGKSDYLMDILMITVLVLIIGVGGYFVKTQMDKYAVPSAYEEACAEYDRLSAEFNHLVSNKQKVTDVQKVKELQARIEVLETRLNEARSNLANAKAKRDAILSAISQEKQAIDSARYTLREADRDYRAKALAELPGTPIGDVLNRRRNHIVKNAIITNLDMRAKKIQLRSDSDMVNWNIKDLAKKQLSPLVRYALGMADLVDMSVLDEEGKPASPKRPVARTETLPAEQPAQEDESYDPAPGAPIISSGQTETISSDPTATPDSEPADTPMWDAPTGALPI